MPPQAAAAPLPNPAEELQPKAEAAVESGKGPESAIEKALDSANVENVVNIFRGKANEEKQALARLGQLDPEELEAAPDTAAQVEAANDASYKKIDQVEEQAIQEIVGVMEPAGTTETKVSPVAEPAPTVEAVKVMPTMKVGEASPAPVVEEEAVPEVKPERNELAEKQKAEAEEVMKEDLEALRSYAQEHHLTLDDNTLQIPDEQLSGLMPVERTYVAVLQAKYHAGDASRAHAEALMAVAAETDPAKKKELSAKAFAAAEVATLKEKAATMMNSQYMNMPEIIALSHGGPGNPTGGSFSGENFAQASPFGADPKPPSQEPPIVSSGPLYTGGGVSGDGIAKIEVYKTPDAKVPPRKPNFIERFFNRNVRDLTYGQVDPDKKGRE